MNDFATEIRHDGALPAPSPDDVYVAVGEHGAARQRAQAEAEAALDDVIAVTRDALERGCDLNLTEVARRAGVHKQTLYNRLPADLIAGRHDTEDPAR